MEAKVALITGASSGIGAHLALTLASVGYSLSLVGRNKSALQDTAYKCTKAGLSPEQILQVAGDLRLEEAVENAIDRTVEKFGRLDVLINSAAFVKFGFVKDFSMADFDRTFDTNVRATFYIIQQAVPHLSLTEGNIINLSSGCTDGVLPGLSVYCASKAALNYLTMTMALEVASKKVRINGISLSSFPTGVHQRANVPDKYISGFFDASDVLLGRLGNLDDVAHTVLFLANNTQSSFITGVIIPLRGGNQLLDDPKRKPFHL